MFLLNKYLLIRKKILIVYNNTIKIVDFNNS